MREEQHDVIPHCQVHDQPAPVTMLLSCTLWQGWFIIPLFVSLPLMSCTQGANAPLSGLVALLGAMHALTAAGASSTYNKRVVFLALAGEPWGYMGSRRFLYEAATGSNATAGLDLHLVEKVRCLAHNLAMPHSVRSVGRRTTPCRINPPIRDVGCAGLSSCLLYRELATCRCCVLCVQVIDMSQVGLLKPLQSNSGTLALYAHAQQGAAYGNASDIVSALTSAAQEEASAATVRWDLCSMRIGVCWHTGSFQDEAKSPSCICKAQCQSLRMLVGIGRHTSQLLCARQCFQPAVAMSAQKRWCAAQSSISV